MSEVKVIWLKKVKGRNDTETNLSEKFCFRNNSTESKCPFCKQHF